MISNVCLVGQQRKSFFIKKEKINIDEISIAKRLVIQKYIDIVMSFIGPNKSELLKERGLEGL